MHEFAWRSPQMGGRLGAAHAVEMPFVFDALGLGTEPTLGPDPPQPLADAMHRAWVAFAVSGDCGWPRYDLTRRQTMRFDTVSRVVDNPLARELALWEGRAVAGLLNDKAQASWGHQDPTTPAAPAALYGVRRIEVAKPERLGNA